MNKQTAEWVRKAEADLEAAARLYRGRPRLSDAVCFHCQQGVEKYLKAILQEGGRPVPRIHDLEMLLLTLEPTWPDLRVLQGGASRLTPYAIAYRYPGSHAAARQASAAIRDAELARRLVRRCLGLRARPPR